MSEEKKDTYEVGIPIDELPPQELSDPESLMAENDTNTPPTEGELDSQDGVVGLPDLFDTEELAAVGLTAELTESEQQEEGIRPSPLLQISEDDEPGSSSTDMAPDEPDQPVADELSLDRLEDSRLEEDLFLEGQITTEQPPGSESGNDSDKTVHLSAAEDEVLIDTEAATETVARDGDDDLASHGESATIDQDLLMGRLETIGLQIEELKREFEGKLKYDNHKDEIIDRLHSELQEYKQDIIKKYVLSIVMDVVKVADDIRKWLAYFRSLDVSERDPRKLFRYLEAIPSDLEDVFYWHGVKPFSHEEGAFDPSRQRAIKKVPTGDPALDKSVAHSIRPGYEWETKVIRQEMVAVYVYQDKQESLDTGMIDE